jgi:hypothetical protein
MESDRKGNKCSTLDFLQKGVSEALGKLCGRGREKFGLVDWKADAVV